MENLWDFFINKVRKYLHIVLCFSPVGDKFRIRARQVGFGICEGWAALGCKPGGLGGVTVPECKPGELKVVQKGEQAIWNTASSPHVILFTPCCLTLTPTQFPALVNCTMFDWCVP